MFSRKEISKILRMVVVGACTAWGVVVAMLFLLNRELFFESFKLWQFHAVVAAGGAAGHVLLGLVNDWATYIRDHR
ncbi:MAG: hypothetical protein A3D67_01230 [Candidatus Lloydbacteria bacterium RIFCSPHIGHO2_02_FULL_51_22]|uniref:DUF4405 domain-containing protein n=1 Tax=Candidatus Lloydbacteria bacterium RIFCSPHIGHO2_02_FULL_51_22 TaxID=1798663 RepID=A0A1G2D913_9BACT|nr:MAG: hypothetical protein A3D67_01230 [Candidatus Lloydbacteria bacterium RIFCSPHIGHO2_02_FULL_51_22]